MLDELRALMRTQLAAHRIAVASGGGSPGGWAVPVLYRAAGLEVDVMVPRWADAAFHLEQDPRALLVIMCSTGDALVWLEYRGLARAVDRADWQDFLPTDVSPAKAQWLYCLFHVTPSRIDFINEGRGWGARETLDCDC